MVAMVMGVFPTEGSSLSMQMSREVQRKKCESISDIRPPSTLSTNHVKILFLPHAIKVFVCLLSEQRDTAAFVSEPKRRKSITPCKTNLKY